MQLAEPYATRPIRFLDMVEHGQWRIKAYGIAYGGRRAPRPEVVNAALALLPRVLPSPAITDSRYGVGFAGVHDGRGCIFAFFDWWEAENELYHRVFVTPLGDLGDFRETTATGPTACVWDLRVLCHERTAWLDHVLRNPAGPDLDAYLADRLNEDA
jgi:hypothetical protein